MVGVEEVKKMIADMAIRGNVNPAILKAIAKAESNFNPKAVSPVGARGLFQFMPKTFKWVCGKLRIPEENRDPYDVKISIACAVWFYRYLANKFEDSSVYIAIAWNWGEGNLKKYFHRVVIDGVEHNSLDSSILAFLPSETYWYVKRITKFVKEFKEV